MQPETNAHNERKKKQTTPPKDQPRSYPAPWKGQLLLACAKCQKKLRRNDPLHPLGKLKKAIKHYARQDTEHFRLRVIETPCLKLCPKDAVTVCSQAQLGRAQCSILSTAEQAHRLYIDCKEQAAEKKVRSLLRRSALDGSGEYATSDNGCYE